MKIFYFFINFKLIILVFLNYFNILILKINKIKNNYNYITKQVREGDILLGETHQELASSPPPAVPNRAAPSPGPLG